MKSILAYVAVSCLLCCCGQGCGGPTERSDGARKISISRSGSLQNPAWSPDGSRLLFTRFRAGYNTGPADLCLYTRADASVTTLVADGSGNVNLPGSSWVGREIVFSSSREPHDEIYIIDEAGAPGDERQVTARSGMAAYEPSLSPDGQWVVFESHALDVEGNGVITKYRVDGTGAYQALTDAGDDCRQPNWSPAGSAILYQKYAGGRWDIWIMHSDGTAHRQVTAGGGDKTDASFSPDGSRIAYSSDEGGLAHANIFVIPAAGGAPARITGYDRGYDGAPSWSPDGTAIAFESCAGDPDRSAGTSLWTIAVPE
jgi:TolB protein